MQESNSLHKWLLSALHKTQWKCQILSWNTQYNGSDSLQFFSSYQGINKDMRTWGTLKSKRTPESIRTGIKWLIN